MLLTQGHRFAIVSSSFNDFITKKLLSGALDGFKEHGCTEESIDIAWVPGAFELPLIAQKMIETKHYSSVVCLGAVIRGETPHFNYVCTQVASGIARISLDTGIPVIFGVLTTNSLIEALKRSGTKLNNKGYQSALAAIQMANLLRNFT